MIAEQRSGNTDRLVLKSGYSFCLLLREPSLLGFRSYLSGLLSAPSKRADSVTKLPTNSVTNSPTPNPGPSLGRQFSWTLPANIIYGLSNFVLLMVLNKWAVSYEMGIAAAGRFNWAMAITAPFFMFGYLRFRTIVATDVQSRFEVRDFFLLRGGVLLAVVLVTSAISGWLFAQGQNAKALLVLALAAAKVAESVSDLCCGLQQRIHRMDRIATSMIAHGVGMVCVFSAIYLWTTDLILAAMGLFLVRLSVLLFYDIPMAKHAAQSIATHVVPVDTAPPSVDPPTAQLEQTSAAKNQSKRIRDLLVLAAPLGITAGFVSLTSNIPKYIIPAVFDDAMLGVYASLAMTIQAGNLIFRAVEMPVLPRLASHIANADSRAFWRLLFVVVAIFVGIAIAGSLVSLLFGGQILSLLFNPAYASMGGLLALVVVCTAVAQVTGIVELAMIPARLTTVQLPLHGITVVLCFLLSVVLIPRFQVAGALLAVTVCRFPFLVIGVRLLARRLRDAERNSGTPSFSDSPTDGIRDAA